MREDILIIDGEPDVETALERVLNDKGFALHWSYTAKDAISIMKQIRFKMVFMDANLPDMKGPELARELKLIDPEINIVVVSGKEQQSEENHALQMEKALFAACIFKPYLHKTIHDVVDEFV